MRHFAHFLHLHDLAEVGQQALVLGVDEAPGPDLEGEIGTLEAIALDGGLQVAVSLGLPLQGGPQVGRGVPGDGQLDQGIFNTIYMLSTLYVERGVPRDGQRDYMLTLYSQHYMLTLFFTKNSATLFVDNIARDF